MNTVVKVCSKIREANSFLDSTLNFYIVHTRIYSRGKDVPIWQRGLFWNAYGDIPYKYGSQNLSGSSFAGKCCVAQVFSKFAVIYVLMMRNVEKSSAILSEWRYIHIRKIFPQRKSYNHKISSLEIKLLRLCIQCGLRLFKGRFLWKFFFT